MAWLTRVVEVPGLGPLRRVWLARRWTGEAPGPDGPLRLVLPGDRRGPDAAAAAIARALLHADPAPWRAALAAERNAAEVPGAPSGPVTWRELVIRPDGPRAPAAMALFEVGWDEEHLWGVGLAGDGAVTGVTVSPGP